MGYCMDCKSCSVVIPAHKVEAALNAVKSMDPAKGSGGSWSGGVKNKSWFSWVDPDVVSGCTTLVDVLNEWSWSAKLHESGDVEIVDFTGEKSGDEDHLFKAIAPFVNDGGLIEMRGEDGVRWLWKFQSGGFKEQAAKVIYEDDDDEDYDD